MKKEKDTLRSHLGELPHDLSDYASKKDINKEIKSLVDRINDYTAHIYDEIYDVQRDISILQICLFVSSCLNVIALAARIMGY